ncbi:MAG: carbamoyl phosphate synthase large subunit [Planctomycetes bacterium]|jgi:carbamoyl-phosphate synthase large subunit|nr:carbamoyl phosphate synthase large subunit [Planctomycetota bacterium]MDP7245660.1 carbamoyl-phosphate synthase large subunit [Planctomycetota bacterium]|tara:strand:- start:21445 stop:24669 length:3225 start_codon:yes stop_codon:yes gene_type:complete
MPRRNDLESILIIGSGPIIIGQACEFDYSGTQAIKALKEEGYRILLINSNPASIMTDPELADRTFIEPITPEIVAKIIEKERPDALLPTLGGQTALNTAMSLQEMGVLEKFGVEMLGARYEVIRKAEARDEFRVAMAKIGLKSAPSEIAHTLAEAQGRVEKVGLPCVIRPAFTMGGSGGGIAWNHEEFDTIVSRGLRLSPVSEVLIEKSLLGWKEFELEVMRDHKDNCVVVCSIENLDPMGVHTGDSITVAPAQTLTDKEYQQMRNAAFAIMREIGVECGGSNVQFALNPENGDLIVIEMNPRVSRSSALASKATGFPIAKFAAKLAVGYTLDEIQNDITKVTPACFEPAIDYVVTKMPRFAFEKFPQSDSTLGTQMKSVGETMAIGRTFEESFQKALRGLEVGRVGFSGKKREFSPEEIRQKVSRPAPGRLFALYDAFCADYEIEEVARLSGVDPWFLAFLQRLAVEDRDLESSTLEDFSEEKLRRLKQRGFSDARLAQATSRSIAEVRAYRESLGIRTGYRLVDTCAAEFEAKTPYLYSTFDFSSDEVPPTSNKKVIILGGGPNRIGQGIEFDYCCVHASLALREMGIESIMVNSNPETVSTDFDISDRLYFEPLTHEDVLAICEREKPDGVIVQFGGQTPLNLAEGLLKAGIPLWGTPFEAIDRAEDRGKFSEMLNKLNLRAPENGIATEEDGAVKIADRIGYPVLVRPSYVLGGRAMEIVYDEKDLRRYMSEAVQASPGHPVLVDRFLEDAIEVDVDCVSDGQQVIIGAVMEHIEEAGIHSGDSTCVIPPTSLGETIEEEIREATRAMALELGVIGLMNVQFAVRGERVYILEVNPRASRTVPYVSKAVDVPFARVATQIMAGHTLVELGIQEPNPESTLAVKAPAFPFAKFPGARADLGPEMRSTGEVMGIDSNFGMAFAKASDAAGRTLPTEGKVFITVKDSDKRSVALVARSLTEMGFELVATDGTWRALSRHGIPCERINKVHEGRPHVVDLIKSRDISLIINTPLGKVTRHDDGMIRSESYQANIPCLTTMSAAMAALEGIQALRQGGPDVCPLQDYFAKDMVTA